jgi:hypothetical protein
MPGVNVQWWRLLLVGSVLAFAHVTTGGFLLIYGGMGGSLWAVHAARVLLWPASLIRSVGGGAIAWVVTGVFWLERIS